MRGTVRALSPPSLKGDPPLIEGLWWSAGLEKYPLKDVEINSSQRTSVHFKLIDLRLADNSLLCILVGGINSKQEVIQKIESSHDAK